MTDIEKTISKIRKELDDLKTWNSEDMRRYKSGMERALYILELGESK